MLLFIVFACTKTDESISDYRDLFIGEYDFTICKYFEIETSDPVFDTIEYLGTIDAFENDKLKIIYSDNPTEPSLQCALPLKINGLLYPTVTDSGELIYPEVTQGCSRSWFSGSFINNDSISMQIGTSALMGANVINIYGKKIDN